MKTLECIHPTATIASQTARQDHPKTGLIAIWEIEPGTNRLTCRWVKTREFADSASS